MKQLEKRKQSLMNMCNQRKRGSDSSQGSSGIGPSKKSSVVSMDPLTSSPSFQKKVLLQEYEEGELPLRGKKDVSKRLSEDSGHPHSESHEKICEMERRVAEELEVELKQPLKRSEEQGALGVSRTWSKSSNFTSPLHSSASDRHSPVGRWTSPTPSEVHPAPSHTPPTFSHHHFPPLSPTATTHTDTGRSGFLDNRSRKVSHSDSSEWTEFACASTSGGSVEVGGRLGSSVNSSSNHLSSKDTLSMSEFDPISTSITGDPPKPPAT